MTVTKKTLAIATQMTGWSSRCTEKQERQEKEVTLPMAILGPIDVRSCYY